MNPLKSICDRPESVGVSARIGDPFTHAVIGRAMETHSALGAGLHEEFYQREFSARLSAADLEHESKPRRNLMHRGFVADTFEPDLHFPHRLVAELKVLRGGFDPEHLTQLLAYLKFHGVATGMLFDFGKESLLFKRIIFTPAEVAFPEVAPPAFVTGRDLADTAMRLFREIYAAHGIGYRETTYQGLFRAALLAERIPFNDAPTSPIGRWGVAQLRCLVVDDACAVSVTALGDGVSATDRATLQTCLRWLDLPWGIAVHFGRRTVDVRFAVKPGKFPADSGRPQI